MSNLVINASTTAGVSRGRGFAPAGRGRGIAKWSSQGTLNGVVAVYQKLKVH